jgi:hypothetical protein
MGKEQSGVPGSTRSKRKEEHAMLQQRIQDLEFKLEVLRGALCKRCRAINVEDPETLLHLQKCNNARKSISHTSEAADLITNAPSVVGSPPSGTRRPRSRSTASRPEESDVPVRQPTSPSSLVTRSNSYQPDSVQLSVRREKSAEDSRSMTKDIKTRVFKNPFARKRSISKRHSAERGSIAPLSRSAEKRATTTGSGVLIPQLPIHSTLPEPPVTLSNLPTALSSSSGSIPTGPSIRGLRMGEPEEGGGESSNEEEEERDLRDVMDYDADEGDDDEMVGPSRGSPKVSSDSSSRESSAHYSPHNNMHQVASQLLSLRQRLIDAGVNERALRELLEVSDILYAESNTTMKRSNRTLLSETPTRRSSLGTDRLKKKTGRTPSRGDLDVSPQLGRRPRALNNATKSKPVTEEAIGNSYQKKLQRTRLFFAEKNGPDPIRGRNRTKSLKDDASLIVAGQRFLSARAERRRHSFEEDQAWTSSPLLPAADSEGLFTPRRIAMAMSDGRMVLESGAALDILEWLLQRERLAVEDVASFLLVYRKFTPPSLLLRHQQPPILPRGVD